METAVETAARLVRWQRITIAVLLWALTVVTLSASLQNKSAHAAPVPTLSRAETRQAALASLEERMTRYERKYGADEPALDGIGVALGPR